MKNDIGICFEQFSSFAKGFAKGVNRIMDVVHYGPNAPIDKINQIKNDNNFIEPVKQIMIKAIVRDANYAAKEKEINNQEKETSNETEWH